MQVGHCSCARLLCFFFYTDNELFYSNPSWFSAFPVKYFERGRKNGNNPGTCTAHRKTRLPLQILAGLVPPAPASPGGGPCSINSRSIQLSAEYPGWFVFICFLYLFSSSIPGGEHPMALSADQAATCFILDPNANTDLHAGRVWLGFICDNGLL